MTRRSDLAGIAAVSVTSLLWGTTGTAATFAPQAGPLAIGAAALGIGGLLQALIALPSLRRERNTLIAHRAVVLTGAVGVAIYPLAFYSSMHLAGVAIGSVVSLGSAPLMSGLIERIVDRQALSRRWMLSAGLGVAGVALLCVSKLDPASMSSEGTLAGIALGLLAGLTYATYSWAVRRLMGSGMGRAAAMGAVFGAGGAALMPVLVLTGAPLLASAHAFGVAAYMALVPMFAGYVLFGFGLARIPASTATTVTLMEPAIATILAVAVVGERLSPVGWLGLVVIAGVLAILTTAPADSAPALTRPVR
ncbi:DMT family transporter [Microbacterium amylolyticum]|uniref:DME family drug/metabolite transporter n=1 Tax=Microbacterium amylolyticum TaxID=936337 RepID=A0ABS4ZFI3_9MICO|nr:EamA family transporter [Microbacterium amylolyticum]MBP2436045.1 DME family drug/metabolite transporter [Microbacterium amylolyticum]